MHATEYQRLAMRTASAQPMRERATNAALGLAGESGEFADHIKKWLYHGHALDLEEASKELGDVAWYLAQACDALGLNLSKVMTENIEKLSIRYPEAFNTEDSLARRDTQDSTIGLSILEAQMD